MLFTVSDPSTANSPTAHKFFKEPDYSLFLALIETSSFLKANASLQSSGNGDSSFSHAQHVTKTGCCRHFPIFTPFLWSNDVYIIHTPYYIYFLPLNSTKFLVTSSHSSSILKSILLFAANRIHSIILWRTSQFSSVQFSCSVVSNSLRPHGLQHDRPPCPSPTPGVYSNSCPLSRWCHPTMSSSVVHFSCLQSFPALGFSQMSQLFTSGGQSIGASASTSVFAMNTQDWFHLEWTGWISLQSKGLSRVFSNTTVQKQWMLFSGQHLTSM